MRESDLDVLVRADVRGLDDLLVGAVALADECCRGGAKEGGGSEEELGEEHFVEESRRGGGVGEECAGKSKGALQTRWDRRAAKKHGTDHARYLSFAVGGAQEVMCLEIRVSRSISGPSRWGACTCRWHETQHGEVQEQH